MLPGHKVYHPETCSVTAEGPDGLAAAPVLPTAASLLWSPSIPPRVPALQKLGGLPLGHGREAPPIGSFCSHRLMALSWNQCLSPNDWKITQPAKWHCRNSCNAHDQIFCLARTSVQVLEMSSSELHFHLFSHPLVKCSILLSVDIPGKGRENAL